MVNKVADLKLWGTVHYDERAITNLLSFAEVRDHPDYNPVYNPKTDCFIITHIPSKPSIEFERVGNHYVHKPTKPTNLKTTKTKTQQTTNLLNAVEENKKMFTKAQVKKADRARDLLYALLAPSMKDPKCVVRTNQIKDNPVTEEDINVAEAHYGLGLSVLKGKGTRCEPTPVRSDYVEIPHKLLKLHGEVHLFMDIMYVNGMAFLTSISGKLMFRHSIFIKNIKSDTIYSTADMTF